MRSTAEPGRVISCVTAFTPARSRPRNNSSLCAATSTSTRCWPSTDPADWRWGGYRALAGRGSPEPFHVISELLVLFGSTPPKAQSAYRRHVLAGLDPDGPDPL